MPGNMTQGYATGMPPNNTGAMGGMATGAMGGMAGMPMNYGNMGMNMGMGMPNSGMCAPPMPNQNMAGQGMNPAMMQGMGANMTASMPNTNRMANNMAGMMNAAPPNWNYGQCVPNQSWGNSNESLAAPYQQSYAAGPVRGGNVSGPPVRSTPYNQSKESKN